MKRLLWSWRLGCVGWVDVCVAFGSHLMFQPGWWDLSQLQRGREGSECQDLHTQGDGDIPNSLCVPGVGGTGTADKGTELCAHPPAEPALLFLQHLCCASGCSWSPSLLWLGRHLKITFPPPAMDRGTLSLGQVAQI